MRAVAGILSSFIRRNHTDSDARTGCIFYKIVELLKDEEQIYLLQCINTKATFRTSITEIVFDLDILHGLHPVQACYIGIEYSKHIKNQYPTKEMQKKQEEKMRKISVCRYGRYKLCFQDRVGKVCFLDQRKDKELTMDPRDIALTEELITEFDAAQAFHIGLLAGLKLNNPAQKVPEKILTKTPYLRLVK